VTRAARRVIRDGRASIVGAASYAALMSTAAEIALGSSAAPLPDAGRAPKFYFRLPDRNGFLEAFHG